MVWPRMQLDSLYRDFRQELFRDEPLLATFPEDASGEPLSERLLRMERRASPLLGGPVGFVVTDVRSYSSFEEFRKWLTASELIR